MSLPVPHVSSPEGLRTSSGVFRHDSPHVSSCERAVERARKALLQRQHEDGHWVGELQGDTILESEYVLLMAFLGREGELRVCKAARYILAQQNASGGWSNYPGGPDDLSVSVKAYFALKVAGHDRNEEYMQRACAAIRALGGAIQCNSFTRFYLALLGQIPYDCCPAVPPEMIFLPKWAYFNIYAMSSWTRTIVIPLSIFYAHKPIRRLPSELGIAELFVTPPDWAQCEPARGRWLSWPRFFVALDHILKWLDPGRPGGRCSFLKKPLAWLRGAAVRRASQWMLTHFEDSDGVGAIFPPIIYTIICLRCLGYADDTPEMIWALQQLENLMIEEEDTLRLQPCFSPVWDTALTLNALAATGLRRQHPAVARGVHWLYDREIRRAGDWSVMNPGLEPAGWCFEYHNGFFPDTDDTAMVLMALARTAQRSEVGYQKSEVGSRKSEVRDQRSEARDQNGYRFEEKTSDRNVRCDFRPPTSDHRPLTSDPRPLTPEERGVRWLLAMQNSDGGWAAFDRDVNREVLTQVPFADHNAMLDPSCPDITARVLEALGQFGYRVGQPEVDRAIACIARTQDRRGCWIGRWGVNYIYGTWQVLLGLQAVQMDSEHPMVRRAVAWLEQVQQPNGAWGESCRSYEDPSTAGQGPPTASQTAWALLGLIAAGEADSPTVKRGIDYLIATQQPDGTWREDQFTGTGFPKVFYLKYHLYSLYFPLMALARSGHSSLVNGHSFLAARQTV
jgi:squalene-hopene/tetraprenyl-beta-curcumene cyclase